MTEILKYRDKEKILERIRRKREALKNEKKARKEDEVRSDIDIGEEIRVCKQKIKQLLWVLNLPAGYVEKESPEELIYRLEKEL